MMEILKSIQDNQNTLVQRMDSIETAQQQNAGYDDYDYEDYDYERECPLVLDPNNNCPGTDDQDPRKLGEESRFACLSKKFKPDEVVGDNIDSVLADTVTNLYRHGMDTNLYEQTIKDELCPRPGNCESLQPAKVNRLIWDIISPNSRSFDLKMQNISTSLVKACVFLVQTMEKLASVEQTLKSKNIDDSNMSGIMDGLNDVLALTGHGNYQTNMARRDLLRPDLSKEYAQLCSDYMAVVFHYYKQFMQ